MISREQLEAAESGQPVDVTLDHMEFVLLRKDVYAKLAAVVNYEPMQPEEAYDAISNAWGDDPGLNAYQDLK